VQPLRRVVRELERDLLRAVLLGVEAALAVGDRRDVAEPPARELAPELHALVPEPGRRRGERDERIRGASLPEAQVVLAERDLEAADLHVEPFLPEQSAQVAVQVADVVLAVAQADDVPLEREARVAVDRHVAHARVAAEVRVQEDPRVVDLCRALLVQPVVLLGLQVVELRAARQPQALRPLRAAASSAAARARRLRGLELGDALLELADGLVERLELGRARTGVLGAGRLAGGQEGERECQGPAA
jgi:hypothetical protein